VKLEEAELLQKSFSQQQAAKTVILNFKAWFVKEPTKRGEKHLNRKERIKKGCTSHFFPYVLYCY
jgi:hypothetical protein